MSGFECAAVALVQLAEVVIHYIYAEYLFSGRVGGAKKAAVYAVGHFAVFLVCIIFDNVFLTTAANPAALFFILFAVYSCGPAAALFNSAVLTAMMVLSEVASCAVLTLPLGNFSAYTSGRAPYLALVVLSKLLYTVFCTAAARVFGPHKSESGGGAGLLRLCIMPAASISVAVLVYYIFMTAEVPAPLHAASSVCLLALLAANIYAVSAYARSEKVNRENLEIKLAKQRDEYDAEYYRMLEEQYERQRILIHDVKNHMQAINGLAAEGNSAEIRRYIAEWSGDGALKKQTRYCRNVILNIIVSETARECERSGVEFHCDIRDKSVDFISDTDISALFGNLLSNACEAAKGSKEKLVELDIRIRPEQKLTVVRVGNSCDEPPKKSENGLFLSRKQDGGNHGLGQKSIRRIVEKYGGSAETYYDEGERRFETVMVFGGGGRGYARQAR